MKFFQLGRRNDGLKKIKWTAIFFIGAGAGVGAGEKNTRSYTTSCLIPPSFSCYL